MNYIIRVQDPTGEWGYQGNDPGGYVRVAQYPKRPSLTAAGLGSLYVGGDLLGMSKGGRPRTVSPSKLPPALVPVVAPDERKIRLSDTGLKVDQMKQAMNDGNEWFRRNPSLETSTFQYYFLYGYERYQSFREKFEGTLEEEPRWYDAGVRFLSTVQNRGGSWGKQAVSTVNGTQPQIATAFAMLFLLRSTRATIEKVIERDGILRGGYGLPSDVSDVRLQNNRIVAPAITGEVADLITMLEENQGEQIENMLENPDTLSLSELGGSGQRVSGSPGARLAHGVVPGAHGGGTRPGAARRAGQRADLDLRPDGSRLASGQEARDALRLISRKFDGFGLSDSPSPGEVRAVVGQWKAWYKTIRPDAAFIQ